MRIIIDEFTDLLVSKQQRYQLRKKRDKCCRVCGKPSNGQTHCKQHKNLNRVSDPIKKACYRAVIAALANGTLKRGHCWCGELGQAHHEDYSQPFDIQWLCHVHHVQKHGRRVFHARPIKVLD